MRKLFLIAFFIVIVLGRTYPKYRQIDQKWARDRIGKSRYSIFAKGSIITTMAMALSGIGKSYNPATLNKWLTANNGYIDGYNFVWNSVQVLGLKFEGKFGKNKIKEALDNDKVVIINARNKNHWALATGYQNDTILVNDPTYSLNSYKLQKIIDGNTVIYSVA